MARTHSHSPHRTIAGHHSTSGLRRLVPAAILVVSLGSLGTALVAQYVFGLIPCELCLYQRWPYRVTIVVSLLALLLLRRSRLLPAVVAFCGLVFAIGGGIAAYHVGVEQHWWQGLAACSGPPGATTLDALRAQLMATKVARCDQVAWSLFGVSMAGWNFLASTIFALACLASVRPVARAAP